ncbi:auxin efflux carrier [Russula compacta]|nr:auxin efflux carrier [Russula compacta]
MSSSATDGAPIWLLFQTVFGSIIQVILLCIAGYILTLRGILNKSTQTQLNVINVNFFTPCLLFSKVAFSLSSDQFQKLWIIPLFFILISGVSLAVASLLGFLFRLNRPQRNFAMAAAMIMNSNSLPVALLQSLAVSVPGLKWGHGDTVDSIVGRALTYLLLCGTMGQFIRWSYGVHLLSKVVPPYEAAHTTGLDNETSLPDEGIDHTEDMRHEDGRGEPGLDHAWRNASRRDHVPILQPVPFTLRVSRAPEPSDPEATSAFNPGVGPEYEDILVPAWSRPTTFVQRIVCTGGRIWRRATGFMKPPLWASVLSLVVALHQPLQHFLDWYLRPVRGAIAQAGDCSIPITLVVLGAYFHTPTDKSELSRSNTPEWQRVTQRLGNRGEGRTVFVVILARMFIAPLLLLPLVVLGALRGSPGVFKDPVFILSQVLLLASPPALTLGQITQTTSEALERLLSRTIFWSYCLVTPPVVVGCALIAMSITRL